MKTEVIDVEDIDIPIKQLTIQKFEKKDEENDWKKFKRMLKKTTIKKLKMDRLTFLQKIGDLTLQKKNLTNGYFKIGELSKKLHTKALKLPEKIHKINNRSRTLFGEEAKIVEEDMNNQRYRLRIFKIICIEDGSEYHFCDDNMHVFNRIVFKREHKKILESQSIDITEKVSEDIVLTKADIMEKLERLEGKIDTLAYKVLKWTVDDEFPAFSEYLDTMWEIGYNNFKKGRRSRFIKTTRMGIAGGDPVVQELMVSVVPFILTILPSAIKCLQVGELSEARKEIKGIVKKEAKTYKVEKRLVNKIENYLMQSIKDWINNNNVRGEE